MDTRSLIYFIAAAEEKSIGRAATRLKISQPALTRQIQLLENEIGVQLFIRTTTGLQITPHGSELLSHAYTIQVELTRAKEMVPIANDNKNETIGIGVYASAILVGVQDILGEFSKSNPGVKLRMHNLRKDLQINLLRQGEIQILFDRYLTPEQDLACELVHREYLSYVALHKKNPLARKKEIFIEDLVDAPRIGANHEIAMAAALSKITGSNAPACHYVDDILSAVTLVGAGLGITFVPPSVLNLNIPNVVYRPCLNHFNTPFDLQCMHRKKDNSPLLNSILEKVREYRSLKISTNEIGGQA